MNPRDLYTTWTRTRGNRLPAEVYPPDCPVHVILGTHRKKATFLNAKLAEAVIQIIRDHPETLAACLMPDHLHWLLKDAAQMLETVHRVKSYSTQVAWKLGHRGKLWQRSFWDHVVREEESLEEVVAYILGNPVRAGLVETIVEYPYQVSPPGSWGAG